MIITIDGPAASGKSSVAKALAKKFDFFYLYTGLLYRAVRFILLRYENYVIDVNEPLSVAVRNELLDFQRQIAERHNVIADGRDCGSVIFPHADLK